ncbi:hypothetical protein BGZ46_003259 [Entomortierella lignicola]|nr:hypothetical protein BGZ46_003259 [Entomortierella lignicola]
MSYKFESTFFSAVQEGSQQNKGPQTRAFDRGDLEGHVFVAYNCLSRNRKNYCEYASYPDLSGFLQAYRSIPDVEKCFNEIIREGRPCAEYYDIDWKLSNGDKSSSEEELMELEQRVFAVFLQARNHFAPEYPVLDKQCRVLSASSDKKLSLHIVIPQYVFQNNNQHMMVFMDSFKTTRENGRYGDNDANLLQYIDAGVYTKNRGIRVLGNSKPTNRSRRLVKASWHLASCAAQDIEFYITNVSQHLKFINLDSIVLVPKHCKDFDHLLQRKAVSKAIPGFKDMPCKQPQTQGLYNNLPGSVVEAAAVVLSNNDGLLHFEVDGFHDGHFQLMRTKSGHCKTCNRTHDSDNAFVTITKQGQLYLHCYRALADGSKKSGLNVGDLDFASKIALRAHQAQTSQRNTITADLTCSYRYLDYAKLKKRGKSLVVCSEPDTAKTTFVKSYMGRNPKDLKYIFVTPRKSLSRNLEDRLHLENHLDFPGLVSGQRVVIQTESLFKLDTKYYTGDFVLVLDEVCSVFDQMTSIATMGRHHKSNNQLLESLMREAKTAIALDADVTDREVEIIKSVRDDVWVIHNTFKPQKGHQVVCYQHEGVLQTKVIDLVTKSRKKVWISCTRSAEYAESLHETLKLQGFKGECITANTPESKKKYISQNINEIVKDLDYFIHTPTITVGIDCKVSHFDYDVGFFVAQSKVTVETSRQMLRRARQVSSQQYHIHIQNETNNLPTAFSDLVEYLQSQEVRLKGCVLDNSGFPFVRRMGQASSVDLDAMYALIYIQTLSKIHSSMNDFYQRFIDQMVEAGCTIHSADAVLRQNEEYTTLTAQNQKALLQAKYKGISEAKSLDFEEFEKLNAKTERSQADEFALKKHDLMKTYGVRDVSIVTPKWVETYSSPQEIEAYRNLVEYMADTTLDITKQEDKSLLEYDQARHNAIDVVHTLSDPISFKLQYAKIILDICGFESPFDHKTIPAMEIKENIDRHWPQLVGKRDMKDASS